MSRPRAARRRGGGHRRPASHGAWRALLTLMLVVVSGLGLALVAACGEDGATVQARVGDEFELRLPTNPSTGYSWRFERRGLQIGIPELPPRTPEASPSVLGAPTTLTVKVKVTQAGTAVLQGYYRRSWVTPPPDPKPDFTLTVQATE